jgi:surface antigen
MKMHLARKLVLAAVLAATSSLASATNWVGVLKDTPAEEFDDEDLRIFLDTSRKALNEGRDNETLSWDNPETRSRGDITVLRSFDWKTHRCKEVRLNNEAGGRKRTSMLNVCSIDGKWRLLSSSELEK